MSLLMRSSSLPKLLFNPNFACQKCFHSLRKPQISFFKSALPKKGVLNALKRHTVTLSDGVDARTQKIVGRWLIGCAGMCFGAVVLGGITRLTESGLSMVSVGEMIKMQSILPGSRPDRMTSCTTRIDCIFDYFTSPTCRKLRMLFRGCLFRVDWKLIKDMSPPRGRKAWEEEFERYKQFPEYKHVLSSGRDMTLQDFKFIFYMEWAHRLWGRATGLVFAIPASVFLYKGWITRAMKPRLAICAGLLGFQGFLGWYMVKSGLEEKPGPNDVPRVSQWRLASHLGTATILYSLFVWTGMSHLRTSQPQITQKIANLARLKGAAHGVTGLVFVTLLSGAFVAGLDAGLTYNTWPKMADRWIPSDLLAYSPKWTNFFENPTTVQFDHRILGKLTVLSIGALWWMCRSAPLPRSTKLAANCLLAMGLVQMALGITTLLTQVHTHVAASHQSGALTLLTISLWLMHELRRLPK